MVDHWKLKWPTSGSESKCMSTKRKDSGRSTDLPNLATEYITISWQQNITLEDIFKIIDNLPKMNLCDFCYIMSTNDKLVFVNVFN